MWWFLCNHHWIGLVNAVLTMTTLHQTQYFSFSVRKFPIHSLYSTKVVSTEYYIVLWWYIHTYIHTYVYMISDVCTHTDTYTHTTYKKKHLKLTLTRKQSLTPSEDVSYRFPTWFPSGRVFHSCMFSNTSYEMQSIFIHLFLYSYSGKSLLWRIPYGAVLILWHRPDSSVHAAMCQW